VAALKNIKVPKIEQGKEHYITKGWQSVKFTEKFSSSPVIIALIESREGWYIEEYFRKLRVELPTIEIPKAPAIPPFSLDIPSLPHPELEKKLADAFEEVAEKYLGDWNVTVAGISFGFNFLRDRIKKVFRVVGAETARIIEKDVWDDTIKKQVDKIESQVENSVNSKIEEIRTVLNTGLKDARDKIATTVSNFRSSIQTGINTVVDYSDDALNKSIDKLYDMMGLPKGTIVTLAAVQKVSATGFEVWSPGASTIHWGALGSAPLPLQPVIESFEVRGSP